MNDVTRIVADGPKWSVVIIARNEEAYIRLCLESVVTAFAGRSYELIFVDSASTDHTVDIAAEFPTKIIRLPPSGFLGPSVGRHIGFRQARGRWILFLDGDSAFCPQWVEEAERVFDAEEQLGGVAGEMEHLLQTEEAGNPAKYNQPYPGSDYVAADYLGGSAAYKRDVLTRTGGFNPYLRSCEEEELGARIRKAGFRLVRLRSTMTRHFPKHAEETAPELLRRIRRGFFVGMGQLARYSYSQELPVGRPFAKIQRHIQMFALLSLGLVAAITSIYAGNWLAIAAWGGVMVTVFALFAIRSGNLRKPAYYFVEWILTCPLVIWGILQHPRSAHEFVISGNSPDTPAA